MPLSKSTRDHDTIRTWAEKRGAVPAEVAGTEKGKQTGILRFAFPKAKGHNDGNLEEISWDDFFEKFDQNGLELIYQEKTAVGAASNFNKLIYPENEHASGSRTSSSRGSSSKAASSGSSSRSARNSSSGRGGIASSASSKSSGSGSRTSSKSTGRGSSSGASSRSTQRKRAA